MSLDDSSRKVERERIRVPALNMVGSSRVPYLFSRILVVLFVLMVLFLAFAPWRQFIRGTGRVIAFNPLDRRVNVESLVSGQIRKLHVVEGQEVKQGAVIAEIQDNDPNLLEHLRTQRTAVVSRIEFAKNRVEALESQIAQQKLAKTQALDAANQRVLATKVASETAVLDFSRVKNLHGKGLVSRRDYEMAILRRDSTAADYLGAEATLKRTENDLNSSIASSSASLQSARSEIAKAGEELTSLEIRVNQTQRQVVTAPRDGIVLQVPVTSGSYLSPGKLICVVIPKTESRFVEMWVTGNDMPLIRSRVEKDGVVTPGSAVRLAFEGWPAIQAIGWPQLAVGTFGGEVIFVDPTDDGTGKFRVVVKPVEDVVDRGDGRGAKKVAWPDAEKWLRQGVRANAWVMLEEVPLWFELWRQLNGFPPIAGGLKAETKQLQK